MDSSSFLRMNGSRNAKKEKKQHIQVFVRVRPINNAESSKKSMTVVDTPTNKEVTVRKKPSDKCSKKFTFDRVFGPKSKQIEVYNEVVSPLLDEILAGYNCTVFAYGQTGSGKTFTMEGVHNDLSLHWRSDTAVGIIPRALSHLFDELALLNVLEYAVSVSFLELYNEELFDLLSSTNDIPKMRLYEDSTKKGTVIVQGLEEVMVKNKHEVYKILQKGSERRQTASTLMNAQSSRSHTIFSVTVHITENTIDGEEYVKTGKLNLVDLAGSENVARSGATDRRAREAGNINQSLLTLGRVITALVERTPHIPYRESKLTRLLQESLGGRTKTSIIATISPASVNFEETLSTLEYAHRAKHITNQPEINQKFSMQTLLRDYVEQIERLKKDLAACREQYGVHLAEDDYNQLKYQLDNQKIEIEEKESHIRALEKTMENKQKIFADLEEKKNEQANELLDMKSMLHNTSQDFKTTKLQLRELEREVEEYQYLIETRAQNENILFFQAQILLNVVDVATKDVLKLHDKIFRKREVEQQNKHAEQIFKSEVGKRIRDIENQICNQSKDLINLCASVKNETEAHTSSHNANLEKSARDISNQCFCVDQSITDKLLTNVNNVYLLYHELLEEKVKNVSSKLEDQCKMYSVIFSTIAPKVQQLIDTHITEDLNIFKKDLLQNIDNLITYANDTLTSISGYDIQMRDRLLRNIDEIKGDIGLLLQNEHQNREKWENFQTIMENLILQYNEIKTQEPGNYSEMCNSFTYITKTCDDIFGQTSHIYTNLDRDKSFQEQVRCDLQTVKDDVVDTVEKCRILVTGNTLLGNTLLNKFKTDLSECSDRLKTYKTVMEKSTRDMQQKMREDKNALTASINNMRNAIGTISNNNAEAVEANKAMISSVLAEMNSKLEDATANVLNQEKKVSAELQELCERIDRFFIEDIYRDVPTGSTPAKRDFHYPRKVVRSPPEYILKKSREVQSLDTIQDEVPLTNENTPIIQELNEELN